MKCATQGCDLPTSGKSKYCKEHKAIARKKWLETIAQANAERDAKYARFEQLLKDAHLAGERAVKATNPEPMIVAEHHNPLDDTSPVKRAWICKQGVCGFAWINIKDRSFNAYLKKHDIGRQDSYYGGRTIWVSAYGQSYELKRAYALAYAHVLNDAGINAYSGSRLD